MPRKKRGKSLLLVDLLILSGVSCGLLSLVNLDYCHSINQLSSIDNVVRRAVIQDTWRKDFTNGVEPGGVLRK
jgi:hypothetical protein